MGRTLFVGAVRVGRERRAASPTTGRRPRPRLSLDDIAGILGAATVGEWKSIAEQRLAALEREVDKLQNARDYLAGALLNRFDHAATECHVMGSEIDRRLTTGTSDAETAENPAADPSVPT